jgi:hypothetical protein
LLIVVRRQDYKKRLGAEEWPRKRWRETIRDANARKRDILLLSQSTKISCDDVVKQNVDVKKKQQEMSDDNVATTTTTSNNDTKQELK